MSGVTITRKALSGHVSPPPAPPVLYDANGRPLPRARVSAAYAVSDAYNAASTTRRPLKEWRPGAGSADAEARGALPAMRARAQDLVRNAPIAAGALNTVVTSTVGTGLQPWPRLDRELLGLSDEQADAWERAARRYWLAWATSKACDVTRRNDFAGQTAVVLRGAWTRGDVFAVRRYVERPGDVFGLKLQLVEADRVSNPNHAPDTDRLSGGVALDADGAPVGYYVRNRFPSEYGWGAGGDRWDPVPAAGPSGDPLVFHVMRGERPGQTRGIPALAPVMETLKQLDRYTESEIAAAVISSFFTVFVTSEAPEPDADGGLVPAGDVSTDPAAEARATAAANTTASAAELRMAPAQIVDLLPGEKIETANPGRPNDKFDPFVLAILRQVGVALELPYELLVKHFTASYSASRAAIIEAWRSTEARRTWLVRDFCQPSYAAVITEAVARGYLAAPGFFEDPLKRMAWCGAVWTGPAMGQLNPADEANAAETRLRIGVSTVQEETVQMTGGDWEQNHPQQAKERRMREAAGLIAEAPAPAASTADARDAADRAATPPTKEAA